MRFWGFCFCFCFDNFRYYLVRDVYDDMMLDGVKPELDTFHSLVASTMKGARLQDAFYFRDEMRALGLVPDVLSVLLVLFYCYYFLFFLS